MLHDNKKSYYAIIPANIRYDKELKPNAKLLYGEITALCNEKGYCWANNSYFSDLYEVGTETVSRWISDLNKQGYITVEILKDEGNQRKIWLREKAIAIDEKSNTPIAQKRKHNITPINSTSNILTHFESFWSAYPKKKSKADAVKAWNKIKPDDDLFKKMMDALDIQKKSKDWLKENGQFIPFPATWLNGKRWEDEVKEEKSVNKEEWGY